MSHLIPVSFRRILLTNLALLAAFALLAPCSAQATPYVVRLVQFSYHGKDNYIQAYASGAFDLSGLTFIQGYGPCPSCPSPVNILGPVYGILSTGSLSSLTSSALYTGPSGPASFGNGDRNGSTFGTGDFVAFDASLNGPPSVLLPQGYVSGTELDGSAVWYGTLASLGVTPGTYTWTWGTAPEQSFTILAVGSSTPVPEPAALGTFGLGMLLTGGFLTLRRRGQRQAC